MVEDRLSKTYQLIEGYIHSGEVDGAELAVSIDGETIVDWYAGSAAEGVPAGPDVIWPLASISKLYTTTAIMALVEEGLLALSQPVVDVLPEYSVDRRSRTRLWHLLTHTSGLIYESPDVEHRLRARTPLRELVDEAFDYPPVAAPGTRFEYSDYGMAIAARMAEVVSGKPFNQVVQERVIERGHLHETYMPPPQEIWERIAHVRDVPAAGTQGAMYNSDYGRRLNHPAFGVFASARDLLRFGMLFWERSNKRVLSRATVRAMTRDQLSGGLPGRLVAHELAHPQPWGLGFMVRGSNLELGFGELASSSTFGHPGASGCLLLIDPENEVALAYLSNRHAASGFERFIHRNATIANAVLASLTN